MIDKIPYLQDLGITAVELLPVFAFDEQDAPRGRERLGLPAALVLRSSSRHTARGVTPLGALDEFRDMVKALHRAGIEVILDVVYNHTTEGGAGGPTLCFRGFANDTYYILDDNAASFADYSGCGNTLNANNSIVRRLILDSLRYWVTEMHVDGFRFDLASILSRDEQRAADGLAATALGHRVGPGARQRQVDRGGVGRRRPVSGRLFCRRQLEGMERPVS